MKKDSTSEKSAWKYRIRSFFRYIAEMTSRRMGSPIAFLLALVLIALWFGSGFYLGFDERWQLIINTGTTIATFLMVILIQNTQYREARSAQLKLDEILYGTKNTRDFFLEIEEESDEELDLLKEEFKKLREKYIEQLKHKKKKRS
ncbi:MAG TPA: low affinity iron permease family protein [Chlamydiales bacterium]|nr:low affinity iron permease family protein [Chlamydiales bacterium]HSX13816.1 low affinity iron permease family protein [Chlamydiales bacterium]